MIQRVQSLFLLFAVIFSSLMILLPFSQMMAPHGDLLKFYCTGLYNIPQEKLIYNTWTLCVLTVVTGLISLVTIFIFQRRVLQMRFCVYNILLTLAQFILILYYFFKFKGVLETNLHSFSFTIILPLVNIFLIFQAFRAIRRDDLLIKSYDRLR
jgi:hypothetical protein